MRKRQPHKQRTERITKENAVDRLFERFLGVKVKQNLRPKSLNQFVLIFNIIKAFHNEKSTKAYYLSDITTNFISDWVGWMKNEDVRYDGHAYTPKSSQTVGLSDETIATRIKRLKTFINWCLKEDLINKTHLLSLKVSVKIAKRLIFSQKMN